MPRDLRPIAAGVVEVARATFIFDILGQTHRSAPTLCSQLSSRQSVATRDLFFITTANILLTHTFLLLSRKNANGIRSMDMQTRG